MFQFIESFRMAIESIRTNKLRSALTLLGISIGLFSIIIVMTAISAIQSSVESTFNQIGRDNFYIQKMPAVRIGGHGSWRKYRKRKDLTIKQAKKLKELTTMPIAVGVSFNRSSLTVKALGESTNPDVRLSGINYDQLIVDDIEIVEGRNISKSDMNIGKNVCIVGQDIVKKLFPRIDPIGRQITISDLVLKIIGVVKKQGSVFGKSQDNFVIVPMNVFIKKYGDNRSASISVRAPSFDKLNATMEEVIGALRAIRKVPPGEENDFEIVTYDQLIDKFNDLTKYFKLGAGVIAFIALIAAGIGIMNIMLVSVTERTKEIGIRIAIGAKKSVIRAQFVTEAIVLSQIGGVIGILLGLIGGNLVALIMGVSIVIPVDWIVIGLSVTTFVGVLFGVYPAVKASNLDPIEALRYE